MTKQSRCQRILQKLRGRAVASTSAQIQRSGRQRMRGVLIMLAVARTAVRALRGPVTCAARPRPRFAAAVAEVQAEANPFSIVRDDLKLMKLRIKALVENTLDEPGRGGGARSSGRSHPLLQEAAREFFERRERAFRPAVVLLVARAVESTEKGKPVSARQCLLAEIVEMMCTATIVHDSVLEDDEESMLGNVAHRTYSQNAGNKVSVLAGDFLLARCSVALSQLGDLTVVELMATALESIVQGGVLKAQARQAGVAPSLDDYEGRVRLKTASLIADACRSAAILAGEAHDSEVANAVYDYATALGLSYQVMFDTIRYHQILELAHVAESDVAISERILQEFISSPPVILSEIADVNAATTSRASLIRLSGNVEAASGLNHAVALSKEHAERAKNALGLLPESREKQALLMMADFVSQEDQVGLQREKYVQSRADAAPV